MQHQPSRNKVLTCRIFLNKASSAKLDRVGNVPIWPQARRMSAPPVYSHHIF